MHSNQTCLRASKKRFVASLAFNQIITLPDRGCPVDLFLPALIYLARESKAFLDTHPSIFFILPLSRHHDFKLSFDYKMLY